jgi:hypothetical protein
MGTGQAGKGMGQGVGGPLPAGTTDPDIPDESVLAEDIVGKNKLQGTDQSEFRNQRLRVPDEDPNPEGVVESFDLLDPAERAKRTFKHRRPV